MVDDLGTGGGETTGMMFALRACGRNFSPEVICRWPPIAGAQR